VLRRHTACQLSHCAAAAAATSKTSQHLVAYLAYHKAAAHLLCPFRDASNIKPPCILDDLRVARCHLRLHPLQPRPEVLQPPLQQESGKSRKAIKFCDCLQLLWRPVHTEKLQAPLQQTESKKTIVSTWRLCDCVQTRCSCNGVEFRLLLVLVRQTLRSAACSRLFTLHRAAI
jgi:hypothetical protein